MHVMALLSRYNCDIFVCYFDIYHSMSYYVANVGHTLIFTTRFLLVVFVPATIVVLMGVSGI